MLPSYITPKDISPFVPVLANFDEKIELDFEAQGTLGDFECKKLSITSGNNFKLSSNASFQHMIKKKKTTTANSRFSKKSFTLMKAVLLMHCDTLVGIKVCSL